MSLKIRNLRKEYDLTQRELAKLIGVSLTTIQNWEWDISKPTEEHLKRLKKAFPQFYNQ